MTHPRRPRLFALLGALLALVCCISASASSWAMWRWTAPRQDTVQQDDGKQTPSSASGSLGVLDEEEEREDEPMAAVERTSVNAPDEMDRPAGWERPTAERPADDPPREPSSPPPRG